MRIKRKYIYFYHPICVLSRLFKLLKAAYVEARYNPHFVVTKEDIDALNPKVELLRDITKRICEARIRWYNEQE